MRILRGQRWLGGLALVLLILAVWRHEHDLQFQPLRLGERLRPLQVYSLAGGSQTVAPAGRPMVINVFATWCGPCRMEAPAFAAASARLRSRGIEVVGIDQQESGSQVRRFARDFKLRYPLYVDTTGITHTVLGARMIPTTLYVDSSGVIRWKHSGPITARTLLGIVADRG